MRVTETQTKIECSTHRHVKLSTLSLTRLRPDLAGPASLVLRSRRAAITFPYRSLIVLPTRERVPFGDARLPSSLRSPPKMTIMRFASLVLLLSFANASEHDGHDHSGGGHGHDDTDPSPPPAPPPCFPSNAAVTLANGQSTRMDALKLGDEIVAVTADGERTTGALSVISLADHTARGVVTVEMTAGNDTITLTPEHHLPVGPSCCTQLKHAKDVQVGETVYVMSGRGERAAARAQRVTATRLSKGDGLHSPVLTNGAFPIVDGFVTSFDSIERVTLAHHGLAHLDAMCQATGTCGLLRRAALAPTRKYIDGYEA